MIIGFFVAFLYYQDFAARVPIKLIAVQSPIRLALSFIIIYLLCAIAIIVVGWFIRKIVHLTPLAWVDRLIGGLIGCLKALFIAFAICLSISSLPIQRIKSDFNNSLVYKSFSALPKGLSLKSLLQKRKYIRTMFKEEPLQQMDTLQQKFEKFKAAVDSAKEVQSSHK
jgi:uncharacterized membrane protein required for colicin V production